MEQRVGAVAGVDREVRVELCHAVGAEMELLGWHAVIGHGGLRLAGGEVRGRCLWDDVGGEGHEPASPG